jgi:hypothetical protein
MPYPCSVCELQFAPKGFSAEGWERQTCRKCESAPGGACEQGPPPGGLAGDSERNLTGRARANSEALYDCSACALLFSPKSFTEDGWAKKVCTACEFSPGYVRSGAHNAGSRPYDDDDALYSCTTCDRVLSFGNFTIEGWGQQTCQDCEGVSCPRCGQKSPRKEFVNDGRARSLCGPCFRKRPRTLEQRLLETVRKLCRKRNLSEAAYWMLEDVKLIIALWQRPTGLPRYRMPRVRIVPRDASKPFTPENAKVVMFGEVFRV